MMSAVNKEGAVMEHLFCLGEFKEMTFELRPEEHIVGTKQRAGCQNENFTRRTICSRINRLFV